MADYSTVVAAEDSSTTVTTESSSAGVAFEDNTVVVTGASVVPAATVIPITASAALTVTPTFSATMLKTIPFSATLPVTPVFSAHATVQAPVTFDAAGTGNSITASNSLTVAHDASAGATVIAWIVYANNAADSGMSAEYGSTPMTQISGSPSMFVNIGGYSFYIAAFEVSGVAAGSATTAFTPHNGSTYMYAETVSYMDVTSVGSLVTVNTGNMTVSSAANHMVTQAFFNPNGGSLLPYNQTIRWNSIGPGWGSTLLVGDAAGASSVSFTAANQYVGGAIDLA